MHLANRITPAVLMLLLFTTRTQAWQVNGVFVGHVTLDPANGGRVPRVATLPDDAGRLWCAWPDYSYTADGSVIVAQCMTPAGVAASGWPAGGRILCAVRHAIAPLLVTDGTGGAFVFWSDWDEGDEFWDVGMQHVTHDGQIASGWPVAGRLLGIHGLFEGFAAVADGAGGTYLAWNNTTPSHREVRVQRRSANGNVALGWPASGVMLTDAAESGPPALIVSGAGIIVAFPDLRNAPPTEPRTDLYAQRILGNGALAPGWPAAGLVVCKADGSQLWPQAVPDGSGGAVIAWSDFRSVSYSPYVIRITSAGALAPGWSEDGRPVCDVACRGSEMRLASDGAAGAFLAWDSWDGNLFHCYAQRIAANGAIAAGWPATGAELGAVQSSRLEPSIAGDGAGGAFVTWIRDWAAGAWPRDVMLQRLNFDGAPGSGWPDHGLPVCEDNTQQWKPQVVPDGAGGGYVVWLDGRNERGGIDLYAQRFDSGGNAPVDAVSNGTTHVFLAAQPNPSTGTTRFFAVGTSGARGTVRVFDIAGRIVRTLADRAVIPSGGAVWDGCDDRGVRVGAGVYAVQVDIAGQSFGTKVVVAR